MTYDYIYEYVHSVSADWTDTFADRDKAAPRASIDIMLIMTVFSEFTVQMVFFS